MHLDLTSSRNLRHRAFILLDQPFMPHNLTRHHQDGATTEEDEARADLEEGQANTII